MYNTTMEYLDLLLLQLYNSGFDKLDPKIPKRDKRILSSLSRQLVSGHFVTENQAKLLVKIFKENSDFISPMVENFQQLVNDFRWSQSFRVIEQVRKIYLSKDDEEGIFIEFSYNKRLRQLMSDLQKDIDGHIKSIGTKKYSILLTEKNVTVVVKTFKSYNFTIDQKILNFFTEIENILASPPISFDLFKIQNEKIIKALESDIGKISDDNLLLLSDRKIRFQYEFLSKIHEKSLAASIAQRTGTKIYINSKETSLDSVIASLNTLSRWPVLFVFNGHDVVETTENLKKMANSLEANGMADDVGIYFRFDNTTDANKQFNSYISNYKFNKNLNQTSKVVGLINNKLPKFIISSGWRPYTIISFSNNFKNNKTSAYFDFTDLIIYYNEKRPLGDVSDIM